VASRIVLDLAGVYLDIKILCACFLSMSRIFPTKVFTMPEPDEVDELVQAWRRERTDLDLAPVEVFSRISRLSRLLDRARRDAFTAQALEPWEFDVLAALRRAGKPYRLSPGQLLRETMVTSGTMTNRIDRLGERGLVERSPDPHDRRGVLVGLTGAGKRSVDGAFESLLDGERELLAELSAAERRELAGLLKRLMKPLR
jgi:DNA-binding MarR family transcriptional regulator